jgi:hypothetical protein
LCETLYASCRKLFADVSEVSMHVVFQLVIWKKMSFECIL